ncbi:MULTISPECIES: Crp/Fnr family transcriptional regulator [Pseudomonas]|uniref:Crp/Fnr family transcriptional regulator n=1 Tax=Pseudomonas TaxID=286 RepID=UPI000C9B29A8|nr:MULTISPECIES: cyclic nucleotide-binding domain-containing protein [Pseudomonas]MBS7559005.1 cyclic nucleotide-binding domain-containing protein [Pseudomonas sp. RC4D1]MCO7578522.1 cyclic nucleotide-binding domain-containing protein [Pseudomonas protegens]MCO7584341.1 cyclic nucleotide-binding domain-containing protein [Pseudomonas chlororaphis]MCO7601608.1 cyclic nucleotide-binding domain-containing protein [Pseudomonas chlororaphis]MDC7816789.1 cyclic nucleotide-binding domain-containing p
MYLMGEQPAYADALINRLQSIPTQLLAGLSPSGSALEFEAVADLSSALPGHQLFLLDSGVIQASVDERPLFYLHEGDLVGLRRGIEQPQWHLSSDTPLILTPYLRTDVFRHIYADEQRSELLLQYLIGQTALLSDAVARLKPPELRSSNGFKRVASGEVLIAQGDEADHVFVILEGHAQAFVDGHKVGDVPKDEIFGAMAVFTGEKRSASVIASEPSTIMLIPKEQFLSLTQSNPRIAHSLIESMARRIDLLNKEVTRLMALNSPSQD